MKSTSDVAFCVKKRVFNVSVMSAVLYGCQSWLDDNIKTIEKLYNWCVKQLLGVCVMMCALLNFGFHHFGLL